jgi:hypothetical protein
MPSQQPLVINITPPIWSVHGRRVGLCNLYAWMHQTSSSRTGLPSVTADLETKAVAPGELSLQRRSLRLDDALDHLPRLLPPVTPLRRSLLLVEKASPAQKR